MKTVGIEKNIDYKEFYFFISRFMHEIKSCGKDKFVLFYESNIQQCRQEMTNIEYRILLSILNLYDDSFTKTAKFDKYIVDVNMYDKIFYKNCIVDFNKLIHKSMTQFYRNGILINKIDDVVGT